MPYPQCPHVPVSRCYNCVADELNMPQWKEVGTFLSGEKIYFNSEKDYCEFLYYLEQWRKEETKV